MFSFLKISVNISCWVMYLLMIKSCKNKKNSVPLCFAFLYNICIFHASWDTLDNQVAFWLQQVCDDNCKQRGL